MTGPPDLTGVLGAVSMSVLLGAVGRGGGVVCEGVSGVGGADAAVWSCATGCAGAPSVCRVTSMIGVGGCGRATAM